MLKTAHLENNRLTQLPRNFPFDKMETLTLSRNAWHCNCQLAHLRKYGTTCPFPPLHSLGSPRMSPPRAMPGKRRVPKAAHVLSSSLPSPLHSWCQRCPWWFVPFLSSPSSFSPRPRWLKGNRTRTDETCSTPAQYRGQSIRDTPALRTCKLPTKRSKKGSRH